ncbi:hypothetical protein HBH68_214170 [Parastagonospora nodorum]|nr:hypothetical protein HBH42_125060 [Parastagonospora nodorum]KAH5171035.1 hypothetical protein HBH68_214170 [Parastagonospora nodorum]
MSWICEDDWEDQDLALKYKEEEDPGGVLEQVRNEAMDDGTYWSLQKEAYKTRREAILQMFRSLVNATCIDIYWLDEFREPNLSIPLFPSARSIRLSGLTTE